MACFGKPSRLYTSGVVKVFGESNATGEGGSTGGSTGGTEGGSTVTPIEGTVW